MLNNEITTKELMRYLKGPDFPTGGIVINKDELEDIYETGTGKIKLRGKVEFQKGKAGTVSYTHLDSYSQLCGKSIYHRGTYAVQMCIRDSICSVIINKGFSGRYICSHEKLGHLGSHAGILDLY